MVNNLEGTILPVHGTIAILAGKAWANLQYQSSYLIPLRYMKQVPT